MEKVRRILPILILFSCIFFSCSHEVSFIDNVSELSANDSVTYNSVTLAWVNPNNKKFDHVKISYSADASDPESVTTTESNYTFTDLTSGTKYLFTVYAYDKKGHSSSGCSIIVKTSDSTVTSIEITSKPTNLEYFEGDTLNMAGFVLTATYSDGKVSTVDDYEYEPTVLETAGTQTVVVTFGSKTIKFPVTVNAVCLTDLKIKTEPSKKTYKLNDSVDFSDAVVEATYNNGKKVELASDAYEYSPEIVDAAGEQTITVIYGGKKATCKVTVSAVALSSITATTPSKTTYNLGASFDKETIKVTAAYSDASTQTITNYSVQPEYFTQLGNQTVTITYGNKSTTLTVNVIKLDSISITSQPAKTSYNLGDTVSTQGLVVTAKYSDNSTQNVSDYKISPSVLNNSGKQVITVSYGEKTATYEVTVTNTLAFTFTVKLPDNQTITDLLTFDETSSTFIAKDGCKAYEWWLDGAKLGYVNGFLKITDKIVDDTEWHTMMVIVTDEKGNKHSSTAEFKLN